MKFRDYVKLNKQGSNKITEGSAIEDKPKRLIPIVMELTEKFYISDCPLEKYQLLIKIIFILMCNLENPFKDDEMIFEKK